jgi:membrane-anchored protein YejM (alkaline phosphatase superfamily)
LGGAIITRHIEHSYNFRIYGSDAFKTATLARRLQVEAEASEKVMHRQQKARDHFTQDFLNQDDHDPMLYNALFNNDRTPPQQIAATIVAYVEAALRLDAHPATEL